VGQLQRVLILLLPQIPLDPEEIDASRERPDTRFKTLVGILPSFQRRDHRANGPAGIDNAAYSCGKVEQSQESPDSWEVDRGGHRWGPQLFIGSDHLFVICYGNQHNDR
jgi:hypothetical protein